MSNGIDLTTVAARVEDTFRAGRRVLSFREYLELVVAEPVRYTRDASRYLRDVFDYYGSRKVQHPWGEFTRYQLFDLPWERTAKGANGQPILPRGALVGQEQVQEEVYRALSNFAREGRPNRLVLLHGPNGSAKSTFVACLMAALEHYSTTDEGALYRYSWVFPSTKTVRGSLGFSQKDDAFSAQESYAHLGDDQIDAKLLIEVRDHPLFLIPTGERQLLLEQLYDKAREKRPVEPPSEWLLKGQLSHKSQQVFEALLSSSKGSYAEVLRHVQVERFFISRRYRVGAVTIGPQMSVDAGERQITADRSLGALPASLQALTLYDAKGELVDAAGGLLEFSDLLKRPLDAFKYLQLTVETGEVSLTQQNVQLNCVMMGSANELHLDAFREHPEFASFRGRLELLRTPYLRSYTLEQGIYDAQVTSQVRKHVAPHSTELAAMFAVLTRMRKPNPERYTRSVGSIVSTLTALEKMDLYAIGRAPERLDADAQKVLKANIADIWAESDSYPIYEGRVGASPREMRIVLLDAAQSPKYDHLSPMAVLEEIDALCQRRSEFEWLQQDPIAGGYHDVKQFREALVGRLLAAWEQEMYTASGLVDEQQYADLFDRYVLHVSSWVKKERLFNRATGGYEDADEKMMREVEKLLDVRSEAQDWRRQLISGIAAFSLDHPGVRIEPVVVFPQHLRKMREAIFSERRTAVAKLTKDVVILLREEGVGLDAEHRKDAEDTVARLHKRYGYEPSSAVEMASMLLRRRFGDIVI